MVIILHFECNSITANETEVGYMALRVVVLPSNKMPDRVNAQLVGVLKARVQFKSWHKLKTNTTKLSIMVANDHNQ